MAASDLGVVVGFFSPCDYILPKRHFAASMARLRDLQIPVSVAQVVKTGQSPQPVPPEFRSTVLHSDCVMFYKENLWNIATRSLECDKLIFLDADVALSPVGWTAKASQALDEFDVIQPYDKAEWQSPSGDVFMTLPPAAAELQHGRCPVLSKHHPGFAWGMTRRAYGQLGGWYDLFASGAGDAAFAFAICDSADPELGRRAKSGMMVGAQPSYYYYRQNALSLGLRIGTVDGVTCSHPWHGDRAHRGYMTRERYFPTPLPDDSHVNRRADGLLEWAVPAPLAAEYFVMRQEDGAITSREAPPNVGSLPNLPVPQGDGGGVDPEKSDAACRRSRL